ncbi:MAG: hypothetical protein JRN39_00125 [Nitrososphaerota archaeon]|nr:hypothetical protein [Nitrososphaerota archaeon]
MKPASYALVVGVLTSLTYGVLFYNGIGWPVAAVSAGFMVFRLLTSLPLAINSQKSIYVSVFSAFVGVVYLFLVVLNNLTFVFYPYLTIVLEVLAVVFSAYASRKVGGKQPSPLDMPVYG